MATRTRFLCVVVIALTTFNLSLLMRTDTLAGEAKGKNIANRSDIKRLPAPLKSRLVELSKRPSSTVPTQAFSEADDPSMLFRYALLDTTRFQANIFTTTIAGINDGMAPTATGANHDRPTIGAVRIVLEPKPGLPTDPEDPGAFIDIFTDISGLFVINNESGWYEGWMIYDLEVPEVEDPRPDGTPNFGTITPADAALLAAMGSGNNVPENLFTTDGNAPRFHSASEHFPDNHPNVLSIFLSMGAYNSLQQSDSHAYWEFNEYTNWVGPLYEFPFTGGFANEFDQGKVAFLSSVVPGSGPSGTGPTGPGPVGQNDPRAVGDNPNNPRDPDRGNPSSVNDADRPMPPNEEHQERRLRFIPSGLAEEIFVDAYMRRASFEPGVTDLAQRIFDAYAYEVGRIDENGDGVISFQEADLEDTSDGGQSNERLYVNATEWQHFAVTRELDDGLLAPRFAPSSRAFVLYGDLVPVEPAVPASTPRDDDDR